MESHRPWEHGIRFKGPDVDLQGRLRKYEMRLGNAESLQALQEEYWFFTPAILYRCGCFTDAPLIDFIYEMRQDVRFYYKKFNRPLFRGLQSPDGDIGWNFALWAIRQAYRQPLITFLSSVTFTDAAHGQILRFGLQEVQVLDPLALDRTVVYRGDLPTLTIGAFGVDGSRYRAAFRSGASPLMDLPCLTYYPPAGAVVAAARAWQQGRNLVDAEQCYRRSQGGSHEGAIGPGGQ